MGVVANMRPDLFKVIVADVPFVDVINTMMEVQCQNESGVSFIPTPYPIPRPL
jgi:hypothetical protein